jgi:glutamate-1-semialdehyde aminotransferase
LQRVFDDNGMGIHVFGKGPMWHMLFSDREPENWRDVLAMADPRMPKLEAEFLRRGLFVLPGNRRFISIRHTEDDLEATFEIANQVCRTLKG